MAYITDSWEQIEQNCASGIAETRYSLGDLKTVAINWGSSTETIDMEIIGFSHDDLPYGVRKTAITFFSKQLLAAYRTMMGTETNTGGWAKSNLRTWCNNDLYNALPSDLRSIIKEVKKLSDGGNGSTKLVETIDKCWLASIDEVYHWNGDNTTDGQGSRYPQTLNHDSGLNGSWLVKAKPDGTTYPWWLRTASTNNGNWKFVSNGGWGCGEDRGTASLAIAFGFCVGLVPGTDDTDYEIKGTRLIQIADQVRRIRGLTTELSPARIVSELAQVPKGTT